MTQRLLAVHAHPDDESSKGAATYAAYVARGAKVTIVSCTGGERGDVQNPGLAEMAMAERDIAGLRRIEMARARAAVGFDHLWLGYADSGLPEHAFDDEVETEPLPVNSFALIPLEISAAPLVRIIRRTRPQVLIAYDETGGYPHPDHIRAHELAVYAMDAAAAPERYPEAGAPWRISKLYYDRIFNEPRVDAVYRRLVELDPGSTIVKGFEQMRERRGRRPDVATTHIPVGDFLETRDAALRAHTSQVSPDSPFFFWPNDVQREVWPYEDFQLVSSLVQTELPESDLFSGIDDSSDLDDVSGTDDAEAAA